ncbi:ABC transporter ATP-binding protein [Chitinophaga sancti]|uniref:ABC transporter ATP-binding protein n=1 Tax=Chitinophaga sancti TaxID=1004 RepID=UPI002A758C3C|nr:ABC transporter ATP-binding protein [Chitinophaga sancti]WPQ62638.1 ABC transporter ATP-binding protein [Chitinophaga sancti]
MVHALEAVQLTKKYNEYTALNNLNLQIEPGEIFCLLGQNGAGKTTTINLFLGFAEATAGSALIKGIKVTPDTAKIRRHIAYIPEIVQLYGNLSGVENLDFFSRLAGFRYSGDSLKSFLNNAGLQEKAHRERLSTYSKGMRQKVGIAIALSKNAEIILMDEPTSGLDPKATDEFTQICKELAKEGRSILMATHDIFNAVNVGSRIGIMKQGNLVHVLNTKDITANELQKLYLEMI